MKMTGKTKKRRARLGYHPRSLMALAIVIVGGLAGCSSDRVTEPELLSPLERSGTHGTIGGFASVQPESISSRFGTPLLDLSASNAGLCVEATVARNTEGRFTGYSTTTIGLAGAKAGNSSRNYRDGITGGVNGFERVTVFSFDSQGRQLRRKDCVIESGERLRQFLAKYQKKNGSSNSSNSAISRLFMAASIGVGTECYYTGWAGAVNCDGEVCYPYMMLRSSSRESGGQVVGEAERIGGGTGAKSYGDTWYCEGGGVLVDNGDGSVTYHMPGGGGGGGDPSSGGDQGSGGDGGDEITPEEENIQLCAVIEGEIGDIAAEMGESAETIDPFMLVDAILVAWDVFDWAQEGYTCAGWDNVMLGVGMMALPGPNIEGIVARGARIPAVKAAIKRGRDAHKAFKLEREALGEMAEVTIEGVTGNISGRGRVDAIAINHSAKEVIVRELKPDNLAARALGETQLMNYLEALTNDGRVVGSSINFKSLRDQGYTFKTILHTYP